MQAPCTTINKQYVIRYKQYKLFIIHSSYQRTILLAKRKIYDSTLNLTLITVIIYTGNKVKSNRGREENYPTGYFFFSPAINISHSVFNFGEATSNIDIGITPDEMLRKIFQKPHSTAGKFAPKNHLFYQSLFFCFLVPEKRIIFAKVQRRIKSKIRLSYRLIFKPLVVN